jgi:hypothetical protein
MSQFREPNSEELLLKSDLIGKHIKIYWDGDDVFYPADVVSYDEASKLHSVLYENDETEKLYSENLLGSIWKIWCGTEEEFELYRKKHVSFQNVKDI